MAAKIVTVFNQKGGCGKTMTCMQLSAAFSLRGFRTLLVDMDKQGTSTIWAGQGGKERSFPAEVISLAPLREKMLGEIEKRADVYDFIFIDCPPAIESSIPWAALNISDIALIPVIPLMDNVWASREAKELARRAKSENPTLLTYCIPSMSRRGNVFKACTEILQDDQEIPLLDAGLQQRNAYGESQMFGLSVHGVSGASAAVKEVEALADVVLQNLGFTVQKKQSKGKTAKQKEEVV
ncbi:Chromosome (plasmid) partitioning protein ParA [Cupriavidus sp. U2]|uniref:ParA family protein n=1 Tax=Cupriavidus TaxID=106589 RepID=UPI000A0581B6|nr:MULTISPECIES: ParA family protein [Cupriavidus]KAI3591718.1 Chromosome (plasmid) partitioning protein ParA [Cupriavidus sp. U2]